MLKAEKIYSKISSNFCYIETMRQTESDTYEHNTAAQPDWKNVGFFGGASVQGI